MTDHSRMHLHERLALLGSECQPLVDAILDVLEEAGPEWCHETLDQFERAGPDDQADMLAFCEAGGPKKCREMRLRHKDGTPTSLDLQRWVEGS